MSRILALTVGPVLAAATACAGPGGTGKAPVPTGLGPAVKKEGTVFSPVSRGQQGCVLYTIRIPGGQAPAALVYRSLDGEFSYGRPDRCFKAGRAP